MLIITEENSLSQYLSVKKVEGWVKQVLTLKQLSSYIQLINFRRLKAPIFFAMKQGAFAFIMLLLAFGFLEYIQNNFRWKPTIIFDGLNFAMAVLGFLLMFASKFLASIYGKK